MLFFRRNRVAPGPAPSTGRRRAFEEPIPGGDGDREDSVEISVIRPSGCWIVRSGLWWRMLQLRNSWASKTPEFDEI
jgi:hypothetical protein